MQALPRLLSEWVFMIGVGSSIGASAARAQGFAPGGSLGGYGATSGYGMTGVGGGGAMVIPYGGMTEGFMPSRMGGGSPLAFRSRPTATMSSSRTSFSLSPASGGMSGGMGRGLGLGGRSAMSGSPGYGRGMGLGGRSSRLGSGGGGMGVIPPSIGYPFRQPPSPSSPSSTGAGMSM
jgi:endoglucanase